MLAYIFWHQRNVQVPREEYQERLKAFHQILQVRRPEGFVASLVLEMQEVPWMKGKSEVYEDWYLVENSAALDPLDQAAVSGICQAPHNAIARMADNGTGGLYRLKSENLDPHTLPRTTSATWFSKPAGMSYQELYSILSKSQVGQEHILWQRQMTMGPAVEFCVHSQTAPQLAEVPVTRVAIHLIYAPEH